MDKRKQLIILLAIIATLTFNFTSKSKFKPNEIKDVLLKQTTAWNKGSHEEFMQGYWNSPQLQFITTKGQKKGYNTVLEMYKKTYNTPEKMGKLEFNIIEINALDQKNSLAQVFGKWEVTHLNDSSKNNGFFSLIMKKIDNQWKIIIDHTY